MIEKVYFKQNVSIIFGYNTTVTQCIGNSYLLQTRLAWIFAVQIKFEKSYFLSKENSNQREKSLYFFLV